MARTNTVSALKQGTDWQFPAGGGLDEVQLRAIEERHAYLIEREGSRPGPAIDPGPALVSVV